MKTIFTFIILCISLSAYNISVIATEAGTKHSTNTFIDSAQFCATTLPNNNGDFSTTIDCELDDIEIGSIQYRFTKRTNSAIIDTLQDIDGYKNKKIGSALLQLALRNLHTIKCYDIKLEATPLHPKNKEEQLLSFEKLIKFYQRHGFIKINSRDNNGSAMLRYAPKDTHNSLCSDSTEKKG